MFAGATTFLPGALDGGAAYDPYRYYADEPTIAGWRELREPISGRRYWNHSGMKLTTWSLTEAVRYGIVEDFLMSGDWSLFLALPEEASFYEDLSWGLDLYPTYPFQAEPVGRIARGAVVVSIGLPHPGIMEVLVYSPEKVVTTCFAKWRFPSASGKRLLQRLPVREQEDPSTALDIRGCEWNIDLHPASVKGIEELIVTETRDPRSPEMGRIAVGTSLRLLYMVGTRARIADVGGGSLSFRGGWVSTVFLDAATTLVRILPLIEKEVEDPYQQVDEHTASEQQQQQQQQQAKAERQGGEPLALEIDRISLGPPLKAKHPAELLAQRYTVIGGWRQMIDPIWQRPMYMHPLSGRATWHLDEVLKTGGLDDFLLGQVWQLCAVDPLALELQLDEEWMFPVYADPGLSGQPMIHLPKGRIFIIQHFDEETRVATVVLPSAAPECPCTIGYARVRLPDGRPLVRAMLQVVNEEGVLADVSTSERAPPQPDEPILEGPYYVTPSDGADEIPVSLGQDLDSDRWARLRRGARIETFEEVAGMRARLPTLEGGGWVSIIGLDLMPLFRKEPTMGYKRATAEDIQDAQLPEEQARDIPVVWPGFGIIRPAKIGPAGPEPEERTLPDLLAKIGGGRAICDWYRDVSPLVSEHSIWRSKLTNTRTTLDELLTRTVWKACVVEVAELHLREAQLATSTEVFVIPRGSLIVAEWVAPNNAVRLLLPQEANAPLPRHVWSDLYSVGGQCLCPIEAPMDCWVEPHGGHLPLERQRNADFSSRLFIGLRQSKDKTSELASKVERGDAVQVAEINGRCARVIVTSRVFMTNYPTGWMDLFDESGWSQLKRREPGQVHHIWEEMSLPAVFEDEIRPPRPVPPVKEHVYELPALLAQLGELEQCSVNVKDWREVRDPIWGRRVFVNRWSGQVIHRLASMSVDYGAVRLKLWFVNLAFAALRTAGGKRAEIILEELRSSLQEKFAVVADVPTKALELSFLDGLDDPSTMEVPSVGSTDSIEDAVQTAAKRGATFCIVIIIKAPGAIMSWATAGLRKAMSVGERFTDLVILILSTVPNFNMLRKDPLMAFDMVKAELEELDIPREKQKGPSEEPAKLTVDEDIIKLRTNLKFAKPKVMQFPGRELGEGNMRALSDGLRAADEAFVEELGLWGCSLGLGGTYALAAALDQGCGRMLQTLLLDDNGITEEAAKALGVTLPQCPALGELSIARNPIGGTGFITIVAGLREATVLIDATDTQLSDLAAQATAQLMARWPRLRTLRLAENPGICAPGAEAMALAALAAPELKLADLKGSSVSPEDATEILKLLSEAGVEVSRLRL